MQRSQSYRLIDMREREREDEYKNLYQRQEVSSSNICNLNPSNLQNVNKIYSLNLPSE